MIICMTNEVPYNTSLEGFFMDHLKDHLKDYLKDILYGNSFAIQIVKLLI